MCFVLCCASLSNLNPKKAQKASLLISSSFVNDQMSFLPCPQINRLRKMKVQLSAHRQNSALFRIFQYLLAPLPYTSVLQELHEKFKSNTLCLLASLPLMRPRFKNLAGVCITALPVTHKKVEKPKLNRRPLPLFYDSPSQCKVRDGTKSSLRERAAEMTHVHSLYTDSGTQQFRNQMLCWLPVSRA